MSTRESTAKTGTVRFYARCAPPLDPGHYSGEARQSVAELPQDDETTKKLTSGFSFFVGAPRFRLNPTDIYAVYPPDGQTGDFSSTLPHVVFTRRTLPWERPLGGDDSGKAPWMALLVFSAGDFAKGESPGEFPPIIARKVQELRSNGTSGPLGPALAPEPSESEDELCNTIDLPYGRFRAVAPALSELGLLSHVREVNTDHKETSSYLTEGWFSVMVANRFPYPAVEGDPPRPPTENRAYLVSLEGMTAHLLAPGQKPTDSEDEKTVRLVVLASWTFFCDAACSFKASIKELTVDRVRVPWKDPRAHPSDPSAPLSLEEKGVQDALAHGYTALSHNTRIGEKAVSWYRGPLVPLRLDVETDYQFMAAADDGLRYSMLDGMMDVTYAAAYQLGRLLALQDRNFATAMVAYRRDTQQQMNRVLARRRTHSVLGGNVGNEENTLMQDYLKAWPDRESPRVNTWSATEVGIAEMYANPSDGAGTHKTSTRQPKCTLSLTSDFDLTMPQAIGQWLARRMLLYGVPFSYLIPDQRMLPTNSIRFFYLDPGWISCLLQGACSIGRVGARETLVDLNLRHSFFQLAIDESTKVRCKTPQASTSDSIKVSPTTPVWNECTGFLLRSPLVKGWQGLEMRAFEVSGDKASTTSQPLRILRIDRLAPDIMFCLFSGVVRRIELVQPSEGMHFGAAAAGSGFKRYHLRSLRAKQEGWAFEPGAQIENSEVGIPLRDHGSKRVVDVLALAQKLRSELDHLKARGPGQELTSAELAVSMIESPGHANFDICPDKGGDHE